MRPGFFWKINYLQISLQYLSRLSLYFHHNVRKLHFRSLKIFFKIFILFCFDKNGDGRRNVKFSNDFSFKVRDFKWHFLTSQWKKNVFGPIWKALKWVAGYSETLKFILPFRPFLGVYPAHPWRPPNHLMLLNCSPILSPKQMIDWRHLLLEKCEILRKAAHFSPSCLGLMGNLGNPLALFFDYNLPIFFAQEGYWRSNLLISRWR